MDFIMEPMPTLPERIVAWIRDNGGDHALLLITVDGQLRPHVMMLARDEVVVVSASRLRLALGEASRSAENLRERTVGTLAIYDADLACVIKTRVRSGPALIMPGVTAFELDIDEIRFDAPSASEGGARLVTGLRFEGRKGREGLQSLLAR